MRVPDPRTDKGYDLARSPPAWLEPVPFNPEALGESRLMFNSPPPYYFVPWAPRIPINFWRSLISKGLVVGRY